MTLKRIRSKVLCAGVLMLAASGCGIGQYDPPPGGAKAMPPARPPSKDAPRAGLFAQPARPTPAAPPAPVAPVTASSDAGLPLGRACRVHFKPIDPGAVATSGQSAPAMPPVQGVLDRVTAEWVVVKGSERTHWIPRSAILQIEASDTP